MFGYRNFELSKILYFVFYGVLFFINFIVSYIFISSVNYFGGIYFIRNGKNNF